MLDKWQRADAFKAGILNLERVYNKFTKPMEILEFY